MNVLLTGATTPLGAAIVDALLARADVGVVVAVGREPAAPRAEHRGVRLVYLNADLTHARAIHDLVWREARAYDVDVVIHAAHHRCARDRGQRVHAQNVLSTRELLLACADHPTVRRFVYRSFAEVYAPHKTSDLIEEEAPLALAPGNPQWVRDRVEADVEVCTRFGRSLSIAVLRCADILAPEVGSQLWDYLQSRVCMRPLGFDPMVNVLSFEDAAAAFALAASSAATGVFNIPGADTLPLSVLIARARRVDVPVPGPLMTPAYALRRLLTRFEFDYRTSASRFHIGGILDGSRARDHLGYAPRTRAVDVLADAHAFDQPV